MKILAIDDQQLILLSVEKRLSELGYDVKTANSGATGIEIYDTYLPDLVLMRRIDFPVTNSGILPIKT